MIIPLKTVISALERPEGWQGEELEFQNQWATPRYRVQMTAYDTEKREVREWEFWTMEDKTRGSYDQVGQVRTRAPLFVDVVAMRELRKELDEALEGEELMSTRREQALDAALKALHKGPPGILRRVVLNDSTPPDYEPVPTYRKDELQAVADVVDAYFKAMRDPDAG